MKLSEILEDLEFIKHEAEKAGSVMDNENILTMYLDHIKQTVKKLKQHFEK